MAGGLTARDFEAGTRTGGPAASAGGSIDPRAPVVLSQCAPFQLGETAIDPLTRQVTYGDGDTERLEPRVMEVLIALRRANGAVVSRDDLTQACWRGLVVGEDAIQRVVQRLRKVAGRDGGFRIDTISKVGYQLVDLSAKGEGQRGDAPSLAVLPFANRSGLDTDEGLALGMAEDLVHALSQGVNVRVIASSTTARFRDKPITDYPAAGQRLGVRYFLGGNVRRVGDMLRVTAELVEAATSGIVWSQRFERHVDEFAQLQGDLVTEVAATLGATIYKLEMDRALRKPSNLTAWECIARALAAIREYGVESLMRSISESQRAIEIAPDYGYARAIHAQTISGAYLSISLPDAEREREIQDHIDRAFVLDPDHAGSLAAIATASAYIGRPADGLPRAKRAIKLRPGHGLAYYAAGVNSLLLSREEEALAHLDEFLRVEPESHLHYITHAWRGMSHARRGNDDAARTAFDEAFTLYPGQFIALLVLTCIEEDAGNSDIARIHLRTARRLEPEANLALLKARVGRFFAGSSRLGAMLAALDRLWPQVTNEA